MSAGQQITDEEAAIVRAWLGGAMLTEIAKARRVEHADVARVIVDTCGTDRNVARAWLNGGPRPETKRRPAPPARRDPPFRGPDPWRDPRDEPAPPRPIEIQRPVAPEPLAQWNIHRCPDCSYLGPAGEHADCEGELQPVVLILLPRTEG